MKQTGQYAFRRYLFQSFAQILYSFSQQTPSQYLGSIVPLKVTVPSSVTIRQEVG
jgi:hypothetical protein